MSASSLRSTCRHAIVSEGSQEKVVQLDHSYREKGNDSFEWRKAQVSTHELVSSVV